MDKVERDALADRLTEMAKEIENIRGPLTGFRAGTIQGLKMAACAIRDNHPKGEE